MKKTFTLFVALFLSVIMYAYPAQSTITVSTMTNGNISVIIDGRQYRANNNYVMINNLSSGYHSIKIFQQSNGRRSGRFNSGMQMIYNNNMFVKPRYDIDIMVSRFGKVFIDEQLNTGNNVENWDDRDNNWNNPNNNWDNNIYQDNNYSYYNNQPMATTAFEKFKQTIKTETFDDAKQALAKQVIADNYFTTDQVKDILELFVFESSKMGIAKYAFKYTVDKNNYYTLTDAFTFSSSKSELLDYIQKNK